MKTLIAAITFLILPLIMTAQSPKSGNVVATEYTHTSDFVIKNTPDLVGYVIHPKEGKFSNSPIIRTVKLGLVEFKITETDLYVVENVKYSTTGITSETDYKNYRLNIQQIAQNRATNSYEIILMDLRNPDVQGHLKVQLNEQDQIIRLQFKPTPNEPERTYELMPPPSDIEQRDGKFFTHSLDIDLEFVTDLWSRKQVIYPFMQIKNRVENRQVSRIYPSDRVKIAFEERTELKGKKEKLVQYVIISQLNESNQEVKTEYISKKIREVAANGKDKTAPKNIEITLITGAENEESTLTLFRSSNQKIASMELLSHDNQKTQYLFRDGKRKN
jgi:hypothetical protein